MKTYPYRDDYWQMVADEMTMAGEDLFAIFPDAFCREDILFFASVPALFPYPDWTEEEKTLIGKVSLLLYVSMKLHILVASPEAEDNHRIELAVLAGDYLSGRFTQICASHRASDLFTAWLDYISRVSHAMTALSLEGAGLAAKHQAHHRLLMDMVLRLQGIGQREDLAETMAQAFESGTWEDVVGQPPLRDLMTSEALTFLGALASHSEASPLESLGRKRLKCS